jgi:hypothetical protein
LNDKTIFEKQLEKTANSEKTSVTKTVWQSNFLKEVDFENLNATKSKKRSRKSRKIHEGI